MRGRASRPPAARPAKGRPGRRKIPATSPLAADLAAIGARLTAAREARGLSGRALDRLSGVKNPGAIEHGRPLALSTAFKLADALGVRRAWLLLGEGPRDLPAATPPTADASTGPDTWTLLDGDAPLTDDEVAALALVHASGVVGAAVAAATADGLVSRGLAECFEGAPATDAHGQPCRVLRLTMAGRVAATAPR